MRQARTLTATFAAAALLAACATPSSSTGPMSFFVTSVGSGKGADLGGLAGADAHCQRLAAYATALGRALSLSETDLGALFRGGYLHDVGKIGIPDALLLKTDRLSAAEYQRIKAHPVIGDRLCGEMRSLRHVRPIVRHHHERLDGSGYPDGLKGDAIPLLEQIMGIVDVYDAITTARPYKPAATQDQAYGELRQEADRGWRRRDLVDAFISLNMETPVAVGAVRPQAGVE